jgi:hypothetical protein
MCICYLKNLAKLTIKKRVPPISRNGQSPNQKKSRFQAAYDLANEAKSRSMGEMSRVNDLTDKINALTSGDKAKPEDVKELANQVHFRFQRHNPF